MEQLDYRIGAVEGAKSGVEYRSALGNTQDGERHETPDGRSWIAVHDVLSDGAPKRDRSGRIVRSADTIHWKHEICNPYGLPLPLEPFTREQWSLIGGERIESLAGPRLEALGRYLFTSDPPLPPANRTLANLVTDCTESTISNYLVAIRNPHCFHLENAAPVINYMQGLTQLSSTEHFEFFGRPNFGGDPNTDPILDGVATHLEDAWDKYQDAGFAAPYLPPGLSKIPVLLDDWGRIRGDTTPNGPIRLNVRVLGESSERLLQALCAHELFHRVQYSYGFRRLDNALPYVEKRPYQYFSEGTASVMEAILYNSLTTNAKVQALLSHPEIGMLDTSYAGMMFWSKYNDAGPDRIRRFLESYRDERAQGNRDDAIRTALGGSTFDDEILSNIRKAFLVPPEPRTPDVDSEHLNILTRLRVTPVIFEQELELHGVVQAYGTDVFLVGGAQVTASVSGERVRQTVDQKMVFVQGGDIASGYSLRIRKDGVTPSMPPPKPVPGVSRIGLAASAALQALGIKVELDHFGNVLIQSQLFTQVALGFRVHIPIDDRNFQRVQSSISSDQPEEPGFGNRDFKRGVFGHQRVRLTTIDSDPGGLLPKLVHAERGVTIEGSNVIIDTKLSFKRSPTATEPDKLEFGFLSMSVTDLSVRDGDQLEPPSCERGSNDCDPETRPAVLLDVVRPKDSTPLPPINLRPGYVVAPFSFLLGGSGTQIEGSLSVVHFRHTHACESFTPLSPPCP